MPEFESSPVFRKSLRGYNRDDVNRYIKILSDRCNEKLEESEKKLSEERAKKNDAVTSLEKAEGRAKDAEKELEELKIRVSELEAVARSDADQNDALKAENRALKESDADIRKELAEADKAVLSLKSENDKLKSESLRLGAAAELHSGGIGINEARERASAILSEAEERAAAMLSKAAVDADLIVSRAEREASIIRLRGKAQKEELAGVIDRELSSAFGTLTDGYGENMNSALVGLSNLYNKLYGDSSDYCDRMVRERSDVLTGIKEKLLRAIEQTGASASDAKEK